MCRRPEDPRPSGRVGRSRELAELEIEDNGTGFDTAQLTQRRRQGHIGLLAINDLISNAGGRVTVNSRPGLGTKVLVEVPTR